MSPGEQVLVRQFKVKEDVGGVFVQGGYAPIEQSERYYLDGHPGMNSLDQIAPGVFQLVNSKRVFRTIK